MIITTSCSGDDDGGTGDCLVCDKAYLKTYDNGELISTQELTWEENLVILGLDGFCVGTDLYRETTINKANDFCPELWPGPDWCMRRCPTEPVY